MNEDIDIGKAMDVISKMLENDDTKKQLEKVIENLAGGEEDYVTLPEETETSEEQDNNNLQNIFSKLPVNKDRRVSLLNSIKPYMNDKRKEKIDAAINIVQILSVSSSLGINKLFEKR